MKIKIFCVSVALLISCVLLPATVSILWMSVEVDFDGARQVQDVHSVSGLVGGVWQVSHFAHHFFQVLVLFLFFWIGAGVNKVFSLCDEYVMDQRRNSLLGRTLEVGDRRVIRPN